MLRVGPARIDALRRDLVARRNYSDEMAARLLDRPEDLSLALVGGGIVDALVLGVSSHTRDVLIACQMVLGLGVDAPLASSIFLLEVERSPGRKELLTFADCAVHPSPTAEQLADIAVQAAEGAVALADLQPRVAMLSFSTHGSASHPAVAKVARATAILRERRPDLVVDGELQGDSALDPTAAAHKLEVVGAVAGRANVLVFPDLDAGNIAYKLVRSLARAPAFGVFLEGYGARVAKLSRGATVDEIVGTAKLLASRAEPARGSHTHAESQRQGPGGTAARLAR